MGRLGTFAEKGFAALTLMLYSGGPLNVILSGGYSQGEDRLAPPDFALNRMLFLLTYAVYFVLLILRWKKVAQVLTKDRIIFGVLGLVAASMIWSDAPDVTLSQGIGLLGTTFFGIYLATRFSPREQLQLLGWSFGLIVGLSLLYAIALPKYGIMGGVHAGTWRGIYGHKNILGKVMSLSSTVFLLLTLQYRRIAWLTGLGLCLSMMLLLLTTSKGALVSVITMMTAAAVCQLFRAQYHLLVISLGTLVVTGGAISTWLVSNIETLVVDVLGKDLTLTGRTTLWASMIEVIKARPWWGYGYQAFWNGWDSAASQIWYMEGWLAPDAHNGFLDVAAQLGLVGLTVFLLGYLVNFLKALMRLRNSSQVEHIWPILFLIYMPLSNVAESSLLKNDAFWVLYVMTSLTMLMPLEERSYRWWEVEHSPGVHLSLGSYGSASTSTGHVVSDD